MDIDMSDLLSAQLLREVYEELSSNEDDPIIIGEIEVKYSMIPGLRSGSKVVWAFEEEHLYYKNSYSKKTDLESCKCYKSGCRARLYIRTDGSAFRHSGINHDRNHGSMYTDFKYMYCFNAMKQQATTAPASTTSFQVYTEVVLE